MAELLEVVRGVDGVERVEAAGSLRRGRETVGDLDILCACADADANDVSLVTSVGYSF